MQPRGLAASWPWGAVAVPLTGLLFVSGVLLLVEVPATPSGAHAAVSAAASWRALHHWAGMLAVVASWLHLVWVWVDAPTVERRPGRWAASAAIALGATGALLFGRILAWDQHGWESYQHLAGAFGADVLRLRPEGARLGLIRAAHLLSALTAVVSAGLLWWQRHRLRFVLSARAWAAAIGTLLAVTVLAEVLPVPLGPAPIADLLVSHPDWPFWWLVPLEGLLGPLGLWLGVLVIGALLALAPRASVRYETPQRFAWSLALLLVWAALSILGFSTFAD